MGKTIAFVIWMWYNFSRLTIKKVGVVFVRKKSIRLLTNSALFLAMGMVLPFFTAQIKEIGDTLLPMHIPVLFCGLVCGPLHGLAIGFLLPLLRGAVFSMPPIYPSGVWMSFELATYGLVIGLCYNRFQKKNIGVVYFSLIFAMFAGRIVWGIVKTVVLGLSGEIFTFHAFLVGGLFDAIPGIILQLVLIPMIMEIVNRIKTK